MRIPLGATLESRDGTVSKDALIKNAICEAVGDAMGVRKRPGLSDIGTIGSGLGQLLTYWNGSIVAVVNDVVTTGIGTGTILSGGSWVADTAASGFTPSGSMVEGPVIDASGKLYFFTGTGSNNWLDTVHTSTDNGLTFTSAATVGLPTATYHSLRFVILGTTLYAISWGTTTSPYYNSVFSSSDGVTWATVTSSAPWAARARPAVCAWDDKIWVIGGYNASGYLNDVWYTADGSAWTQATAAAAFSGRWYHSAVGVGDALWVLSGYDGSSKYDVWTSADGITFTQASANAGWTSSGSQDLPYHPFTDGEVVFIPVNDAGTTKKLFRSQDGATWTNAYNITWTDAASMKTRGWITGGVARVTSSNASTLSSTVEINDGSTVNSNLSPTTAGEQADAMGAGSSAGTNLLMIKTATQGWTVTPGGVASAITDVDYPAVYTVPISTLTRSGTTATATTTSEAYFRVGDNVTIAGAVQTNYNITAPILTVTRSGATAAATAPIEITITRSSTTATATTVSEPHGYSNGQSITIAGAADNAYNGTVAITYISPTQFSYTVSVTSGNGPASPATGSPVVATLTLGVCDFATNLKWNSGTLSYGPYNATDYTTWLVTAGSQGSGWIGSVSNGNTIRLDMPGASVVIEGTVANKSSTTFELTGVPSQLPSSSTNTGVSKIGGLPSITSIVRSGKNVTFTFGASHNVGAGGSVSVTTATEVAYNRLYTNARVISATVLLFEVPEWTSDTPLSPATGNITAKRNATVVTNTFTYTVAGSPATPATGTITAKSGKQTVPGIAYINGYFCVMDELSVIYISGQDDPRTWEPLDFLVAQSAIGAGVALANSQAYVVAFKEWSTEFFYDAKNPVGSPLSPVESAFTQIGCASGRSVKLLDGSIFWVSQILGKGRGVHMMQGIQQQPIATPAVSRILEADDLADVYAIGMKLGGHPLYVLTLKTSGLTLVYDVSTQIWTTWTTLTIGSSKSVSSITRSGTTATVTTAAAHGLSDGDPVKLSGANQSDYNGTFQIAYLTTTTFDIEVANSPASPATGTILAYPYTESHFKMTHYSEANGVPVALHETDGHVYQITESEYQDNGAPINTLIRSRRIDGGDTKLKKSPRATLVGEVGTGTAMIRWSDDDYTTFSAYRRVDLTRSEPMIRRLGSFRRRSFDIKHIADATFRAEALQLQTEGESNA